MTMRSMNVSRDRCGAAKPTTRLPIARVLERFAAVIMFAVLVYMLGIVISMLEVWQRPPRAGGMSGVSAIMHAAATGNPQAGTREYRRALPVVIGAPCVLIVHGADGLGLISSRMVCAGQVCIETDLAIDRQGRVVCTPEAPR
ncbi:hypothetical protein [Pseudorhodoplanes sp.]|uniref:hypothetical protein n=1 Tax=Pseudorhodoplanes sp. TaxID=1934341 RepID=UPI003D0D3DD1